MILDKNLEFINTENMGTPYLAFQYILFGLYYIQTEDFNQARNYLYKAKFFYEGSLVNDISDGSLCYERIGDYYSAIDLNDSALWIFLQIPTHSMILINEDYMTF